MALTENNPTNTGATTYPFTFPYLKPTDVKVSVGGVVKTYLTHWEFDTPTTIKFKTGHVPAAGQGTIRIYRETDDSKLEAQFFAGSAIKSSDLNDNFTQNLYVTQESNNKIDAAWTSGDETIISSEPWVSADNRVSSTAAQDARIDSKIDTALTTDVVAGNKITVTDNSPGSGQITVGVTTASLVNSDINNAAAIAGTKVDPNFGSQNIVTSGTAATGAASVTGNITVSGTVDGRDVAADGTKLDGIEIGATADQTNAEIRAAVEAATNSNVFTDADHSKLNAIEPSATADQTDAEIRTAVESATDSNVFTDADHSKLNAIEPLATADQTASEIKTLIASSPLDDSHLAANSVGDSEIVTGALDNRYYTKTTSDARYFNISTGDTIKDGDTFPDNDTTIATTAAINDRIIDLVDDVGGFVPIANETSFPNANPDVNNGAGTLVSIKTLASNLTSNGSGVATVANGTVGNSTVTITGLENSTTYNSGFGMIVETTTTLNTYTFHRLVPKATEVSTVAGNIANINTVGNNNTNINTVAGANSNITTVATNISNVNNVGGSIANVNTVANNINSVNDFSDVYRVSSSAPTSHLHQGDLYFDTTSDELRVYNGSAWQGGVTATGNLASLGANTFTGAQTFVSSQTFDGRDVSVDGSKLDGIEAGATGDQTNAEIRAAVEAASDSNVFTDADHTKLNAIEAGATGDQTNAEIRAAVEAASDSHVFTDADHTKLNAIESGATADQTKSDIDALNIVAASCTGSSGSCTGNAATATNANAADTIDVAISGANATYYPTFTGNNGAGQDLSIRANGYTFNPSSNTLTAGTFSGSGASLTNVNAATIDGIASGSLLRSDTNDSTSGILTIQGHQFQNHNSSNFIIDMAASGSAGLALRDSGNNFRLQMYGSSGGSYGFLDSLWGNWDIQKTFGGALKVDLGGTLYEVINTGNVGSSGALASTQVFAQSFRGSDWFYLRNTTAGLYWEGGSAGGWHFYPSNTSTMGFRAGSTGGCQLQLRTSNNSTRGSVYANNNDEIGLLNPSGSWSLRCSSNKNVHVFNGLFPYTDNNMYCGSSSNRWQRVYATEFHGDGSNLTNLPAGGASFTATASGALAANKAVFVNANGTVSQVDTTTTPFPLNDGPSHAGNTWVRTGKNDGAVPTYDATHDKLIVVDTGYEVTCMNIHSMGFPQGNNSMTNLNHSSSTTMEDLSWGIYSPDNGLVAVLLGSYGPGSMRLIEPTSASGTNGHGMNISSAHNFSSSNGSAYFVNGCYDENVNKFIICWADKSNSYRGYIRTATVSGTNSSASVSYGSTTQFESSDVRHCRLVYDSTNNRSYLVYIKTNNNIYCRYITTSGTNITLGSAQTVTQGYGNASYLNGVRAMYGSTDNKLVLCYPSSSSGWRAWKAIAGTPGSSSVSWGSPANVSGSTETYMNGDAVWEGKSNQYFVSYRSYPGSGSYTKVEKFAVNSNNTLSSGGDWNNNWQNQDKQLMCVAPKDSTHLSEGFVYVSANNNNASHGHIIHFKTTNTVSNLPGPNYYVGFPKQAYSNGQTATIQTFGSVVEGFSGLRPGWPYFVQGHGGVADSPATNSIWPVGDGFTWDNSTNQRHVDAENSWYPNASSATQTAQFSNSPLAGLALGTDKILLTAAVHHRSPYGNWQNNQHTHGG